MTPGRREMLSAGPGMLTAGPQTLAGPGTLTAGRAALGVAYLARAARPGASRPAAPVTAVLGARQLAQAVLSAGRPSRAVLVLGAEVDAVHAASMLGLGLLSARWRPFARREVLVAGTLAAAGLVSARAVPGPARGSGSGLGQSLVAWRNRCAGRLASYLAPPALRDER